METHSSKTKPLFEKVQKGIFLVGFSVLSGMFGLGLTWLVFAVTVLPWFKSSNHGFDPIAWCMPVLLIGGVAGFIIGLIFSLKKAAGGTAAVAEFDRDYVGGRGRGHIYAGFPLLIVALLTPFFDRITRLVGQKYDVYVFLGIALVVFVTIIILQEKIPERWTMLMGIIGWLLILLLAVWYCFFGPGAFGHSTF
ncbi:MAG TPA: hypothetical protein VG347_23520 [Verrucomicrobiae bacterium]|nr:hypothetical protein [Verrucomicrobiae bacterium]